MQLPDQEAAFFQKPPAPLDMRHGQTRAMRYGPETAQLAHGSDMRCSLDSQHGRTLNIES